MTSQTARPEYIGGPLCGEPCGYVESSVAVKNPITAGKQMVVGEFLYERRPDGHYQLTVQTA